MAHRALLSSPPACGRGPGGGRSSCPSALAISLVFLSGCVVTFGDLPDAGAPSCDCTVGEECFRALELDPDDPCLECRPERSASELTNVCGGAIVETTFEDFADGTMRRSLGNLYVSADGTIRVVHTSDASGDGYPDLVFANFVDDLNRFDLSSYVYLGSESGFAREARADLPTSGAITASSADLNADGFVDLVFSCHIDNFGRRDIGSRIYWGSEQGFSADELDLLPTFSASGNAIADLDNDGYLDIVFANQYFGTYAVDSFIYWGGPGGFRDANRSSLPTVGGSGVSVADLNADGFLDLVFSNLTNGVTNVIDSYVYFGSSLGFSDASRTALPTIGSNDNAIADVNADGWLDIVFASYHEAMVYQQPSYVYLGGPAGFAVEQRWMLPTLGALATSIADVDADGLLDIVFANHFDGVTRNVESYVYRGSAGAPIEPALGLPVIGAQGVHVADFDLDGSLDVSVASFMDDLGVRARDSLVFRGAAGGPSPSGPTPLPTIGAQTGVRADLGNLYDRSDVEEYESSVLEIPNGALATRLSWLAETPHGSSVELYLRSAADAASLETAPWILHPRPFARVLESPGHRYFQYRIVLRRPGFVGLPLVHAVTLHYLE